MRGTISALFLIFVAIYCMFIFYTSLPVVATSHSTGRCVYVEPIQAGTCYNLPRRYLNRTVQ